MTKQKLVYLMAALFLGASDLQAQFSLEVDNETVVPSGELVEILYNPESKAFFLRSVHADWRCVATTGPTPEVSPGDFRLVVDQINPATESDAVYRIAGPADGGSITQDLSGNRIIIQTTSDPDAQLTCTPFRASFSSSGFENPLNSESDPPQSLFTAGGVLTIPVTVTNNSKSMVVTDVAVDFSSSTDPAGAAGVSDPSFSDPVTQPAPGAWRWTVDVLFPGDSRTVDVEYMVDSQTAPGTVIMTESVVAEAKNRAGDAPIDVGTPAGDIADVTVGAASGDLTAGFQTNDPVAGLNNENLVLTYSITNNAGISMTSVQATLDPVNIPSGVTAGSVTPSAGTLTGNQWDVPSITPGQTVTLDQAFTADASTAAGAQVCGSFTIDSAAEQLVNTVDDSAGSCATIAREIDLSSTAAVVKPAFGATDVNAGEVFGIQLQVNNDGPSNASSVAASVTLSVSPPDGGIVINATSSSSGFGDVNVSGDGTAADFSVTGEVEPNGVARSADIDVDIPSVTTDQTEVCLGVTDLSGAELEANPGNELPPATCITVVNTGT